MRRLFVFLFILLFVIGIFIAFLPTIISTTWGQNQLTAMINRNIPGRVEVENIRLQWGSGQSIEGLTLKDEMGFPVVSFDKLMAEATLTQLITKSTHLGHIDLKNLQASITTNEKGVNSLSSSLGLKNLANQKIIIPSTIVLTNTNATVNLPIKDEALTLHLSGETYNGQLKGNFDVQAVIPSLKGDNWSYLSDDAQKLFNSERGKDIVLSADIQNIPVDLIDQLISLEKPELNGLFRAIFGDKLSINLSKESDPNGLAFQLKMKTPLFEGHLIGKVVNNQFSIQTPTSFQFLLKPDSINPFSHNLFELVKPTILKIDLNELAFPLSLLADNTPIDPCQFSFAANLQLLENMLVEMDSIGTTEVSNFKIAISSPACSKTIHMQLSGQASQEQQPFDFHFDSSILKPLILKDFIPKIEKDNPATLTIDHFPLSLLSAYSKQSQHIRDVLGTHVNLGLVVNQSKINTFELSLSLETERISMKPIQFTIDKDISNQNAIQLIFSLEPHSVNPYLSEHQLSLVTPFEGRVSSSGEAVLTGPVQLQYKLSSDTMKALYQGNSDLELLNTPSAYLKIEPFQVNLKNLKLDDLIMKGVLSFDSIHFKNKGGTQATLDQVDIPWEVNSPLNMIRLNVKAKAYADQSSKPGQFAAQFLISNWLKKGLFEISDLTIEITSNFTSLPTSLASALLSQNDLTPLFGPILDLELKTLIDRNQRTLGYWDMTLDSRNFHIKARLKISDAISLYESTSDAARFRLTLTQDGYQYLNKLLGKTSKEMALAEPVVLKGFLSELHIPLNNTHSILEKGIINLNFETSDIAWINSAIPTFKLKGQINSTNLIDHVHSHIQAAKNNSTLYLNGHLSHLFNENGKPDFEKCDISLDLQATQLPVAILQGLFILDEATQKEIGAVIGNEVEARFSAQLHQMEGPIEADVGGTNGKISLNARVEKGILLLNKPFELQLKITPELSQTLLKNRFSLFSTALPSDAPIKLEIDPTGFSLPIYPFNLKGLTISKGTLFLNKIQFYNQGEIKNILNFFKPIQTDQFSIWFTPLYFQLKQEELTIHRLDFLVAQLYSLALWGNINLTTHKSNLTLGLGEDTLRHAFNVSGLDADYILQIPLKMKNGKIELDQKKAITSISALVAQSEGSSQGKIIGNILQFANKIGSPTSVTPQPTTQPLPWRQDSVQQTNTQSVKDRKEYNANIKEKDESQELDESKQQTKKNKSSKSSKKDRSKLLQELEKGAANFLDLLSQPK